MLFLGLNSCRIGELDENKYPQNSQIFERLNPLFRNFEILAFFDVFGERNSVL